MNAKMARRILRGCAWSGADDHEREIVAAKRKLEKDAGFKAEFAQQREFDRLLGEKLGAQPSDELGARLDQLGAKLTARSPRRNWLRDPAMVAVAFAFIVLLALVGWIVWGSGGIFGGMAEVEKLAIMGDRARIDQFEPVETTAGTLGDWFVMQGFDGFQVPPGFEGAKVVGVRLFDYENVPVAVAAVGEPRSFMYVFQADPLGLSLDEGEWRFVEYNDGRSVLAVRQLGPVAFMTTMTGDREKIIEYVRTTSGGN